MHVAGCTDFSCNGLLRSIVHLRIGECSWHAYQCSSRSSFHRLDLLLDARVDMVTAGALGHVARSTRMLARVSHRGRGRDSGGADAEVG